MLRIVGAALLVLGLYGLVGLPQEIGFFWGGIAAVAMGSMLVAFGFSAAPADRVLRIEPKLLRDFDALGDLDPKPAAQVEPSLAAPARGRHAPIGIAPADLRSGPGVPDRASETRPDAAPAVTRLPIPRPAKKPAAYGWFGPDRAIQVASGLGEITAAIRSGALKPQTSVHCMDAAGSSGPARAAHIDPLLRALFWAIAAEIPEAALPGLVRSLTEAGSPAEVPVRKTLAG